MGTRADFYVGVGENAEWLGSIALDGYPDGIPDELLKDQSAEEWRIKVGAFLLGREDASIAGEHEWPWPWKDSATTDYSYWLHPEYNEVAVQCFGMVDIDTAIEELQIPWPWPMPKFSTEGHAHPGGRRSGVIGLRRKAE